MVAARSTPYADSCTRLRLALELLEGFRERIAALPEGPTKPTEPAAAAVGASEDGAEFVPAATFERPRDGYAFTTGVQGTGYYRLDAVRTEDSADRRQAAAKPINRHARQPEQQQPAPGPVRTASSQSAGTGSSGGPYSELTRSTGVSPRGAGPLFGTFNQNVVSSDSDVSSADRDSPVTTRQPPAQQSASEKRLAARASTPRLPYVHTFTRSRSIHSQKNKPAASVVCSRARGRGERVGCGREHLRGAASTEDHVSDE
jgi:hypothetical protein